MLIKKTMMVFIVVSTIYVSAAYFSLFSMNQGTELPSVSMEENPVLLTNIVAEVINVTSAAEYTATDGDKVYTVVNSHLDGWTDTQTELAKKMIDGQTVELIGATIIKNQTSENVILQPSEILVNGKSLNEELSKLYVE